VLFTDPEIVDNERAEHGNGVGNGVTFRRPRSPPETQLLATDKRDTVPHINELTPVDSATPTQQTPLPLPKPPGTNKLPSAPRLPKLPRLGKQSPARPGRRGDAGSDMQVTSKIERVTVEKTPAPLPPSPAAEDADVWFEQVPTNPAAIPDLGDLASGTNPGGRSLTAPMRKLSPGNLARDLTGTHYSQPYTRPSLSERPWLLPILLAVTCLAVGMVLGALLFGGGSSDEPAGDPCTECAEQSAD
jgi:hypothetical protein